MAGLDFKDILTAEQVEEIKALARDDLEDPAVRIGIYDALLQPIPGPTGSPANRGEAIIHALTSVKQKLDEIANNSGYINPSTEYTQFVNSLYVETRDKVLMKIGASVAKSIEGKIEEIEKLEAELGEITTDINESTKSLTDTIAELRAATHGGKDDSYRKQLAINKLNLEQQIKDLKIREDKANRTINKLEKDILGSSGASTHHAANEIAYHGNQLIKTLKQHLSALAAPIPYELAVNSSNPDEVILNGPVPPAAPGGGPIVAGHITPFTSEYNRFVEGIFNKAVTDLTDIEKAFLAQEQARARDALFDTTTTPIEHAWIGLSHGDCLDRFTGADAVKNSYLAQKFAQTLVENAFSTSPAQILVPAATITLSTGTPPNNFTNKTTNNLVYPSATTLRLYAQANGIDARVPNAAFKQALIAQLGKDILGEVPETETMDPKESANILERMETAYSEKRANFHKRRFLPTTFLKNAFGDRESLKWIGFGETSDAELANAREELEKARLIHARNTIAANFSDDKSDIIKDPGAKAQLINEVMAFTLDSRDRVINKERETRSKNKTWHERLENLINQHPFMAAGIAAGAVGVGILGVAVAGPVAAPWIAGAAGLTAGVIKTKLVSRLLQAGIGKIGFWGRKSSAEEYHGAPKGSGFDVNQETSDTAHKKLGRAIAVFSTDEHHRRYKSGSKWLNDVLLWRADEVKTQGKNEARLFEPTLFKQELNNHLKQYMKTTGGTSVSGFPFPFKAPAAEQKAAVINELIAFAISKREAEIEKIAEEHKRQLARIGAFSDVASALLLGFGGGAAVKELTQGGGTLLAKGWHSFWDGAANWWNGTPVEAASDKVADAIDAGKEATTPQKADSGGVINWVKGKVSAITDAVSGDEAAPVTAAAGDFTFTVPTGPETPGITQILEQALGLNDDQVSDLGQYFGQIKDMNSMADINKIYDGESLTLPEKMIEHMAKMKGISVAEVQSKITAFAAK